MLGAGGSGHSAAGPASENGSDEGETGMRKTARGAVLATAVALVLTGCGSSGDENEDAKQKTESSAPDGGSDEAADEKSDAGDNGADDGTTTREVTLEVSGEGTVVGGVTYMLNSMETEQLDTLPWTKTETLPLRGAEVKVGRAVTVTPPSVQEPSGKLVPATCVIKVDGKKIADNTNKEGGSGCSATVK